MSKYVLMSVDKIKLLVGPENGEISLDDREEVFDYFQLVLSQAESGETTTLNPENVIMMLISSLKIALTDKDPLNDKFIKLIWPIVEKELKERGVL